MTPQVGSKGKEIR